MLRAAAAEAAEAAGLDGKWVFTLQAPSLWPFLRALRLYSSSPHSHLKRPATGGDRI